MSRAAMQTVRAKLLVPRVPPDHVPRPRLDARLDEGLARRLTLVSAPAGFGKTTLLCAWLQQAGCPAAWVTLDESDNDLVTFFSYVIAAVRTVYADTCAESVALLGGPSRPPRTVLAATLANDLDALPGELVLVLDELQCVDDEDTHAVLDQLIAYLSPRVHLVLGTRTDPPLSLATLCARGQLEELREDDLCFTADEARDFLAQFAGKGVDEPARAALVERAAGWAAGLRLLALSARPGSRGEVGDGRSVRGDAYVMTYLADEVLRKEPLEVQDFMLRSAVVERFSASLCRALVGDGADEEHCGGLIERIVADRVFVTPLGEGWYRYHPLFRELLLNRLRRTVSAQEFADVHRRAVAWYDEAGMVRQALAHAFLAGDTARAVGLVARHRTDAMNREQWQEIDHWLSLFPADVLAEDLLLGVTHAWLEHMRMKLSEVEPTVRRLAGRLAHAVPGLDDATRRTLSGETAAIGSAIAFWSGRFAQSREEAIAALDRLPLERSDGRGVAYVFRTFSEHYGGDAATAEDVLASAWSEEHKDSGSFPSRLLITEFDLAFLGFDLARIERAISRMEELARGRGLVESTGWAHFCRGRVAYLRNQLDDAHAHFEQVAAHPYTTHVYPACESLMGLVLVSLARRRFDDVARGEEALVRYAREIDSTYVRDAVQSFRAHLAILDGRIEQAVAWADTFDSSTPFVPTARCEYSAVTFVKALLATGTPERLARASTRLAALEATATGCGAKVCLVEILALKAWLRDAEGDREAALHALAEATRLHAGGSPVRVFADLAPEIRARIAELLVELGRRGGSGPVESILAVLRPVEASSPAIVEPFSRREREILALLERDLSNKEIAERLFISTKTVEGHTAKLYQKLGVNSRRKAVAKARSLRILPLA